MQTQFPKLRIIPIDKLILHEKAEPRRIERLVQRVKKDGYFKNPIIVADFNEGSKFLVLDGVHRVKSLAELGCKDIVAQVVNYFDKGIKLYTWDHLISGCGRKKLLKKIGEVKGINLIETNREAAEKMLKGKKLIGYLLFADGNAFCVKAANGLRERTEKLLAVMNACEKFAEIERASKNDSPFSLKRRKKTGAVLVIPSYTKKEILKVAKEGKVLPAGVTRHIIPNRVLGLDICLLMLKNDLSLSAKNKSLGKFIDNKIKEKRIRFYSDSVFVFDE